LRSGSGTTTKLEKSSSYDFRISWRNIERTILGLQVPTQDTIIDIDSPFYDFRETLQLEYTKNGTELNLIYQDIEIPDLACEEYREATTSNGGGRDDD